MDLNIPLVVGKEDPSGLSLKERLCAAQVCSFVCACIMYYANAHRKAVRHIEHVKLQMSAEQKSYGSDHGIDLDREGLSTWPSRLSCVPMFSDAHHPALGRRLATTLWRWCTDLLLLAGSLMQTSGCADRPGLISTCTKQMKGPRAVALRKKDTAPCVQGLETAYRC